MNEEIKKVNTGLPNASDSDSVPASEDFSSDLDLDSLPELPEDYSEESKAEELENVPQSIKDIFGWDD